MAQKMYLKGVYLVRIFYQLFRCSKGVFLIPAFNLNSAEYCSYMKPIWMDVEIHRTKVYKKSRTGFRVGNK